MAGVTDVFIKGKDDDESAVQWSGKMNFGQGKLSEKSGNFISD